MCDRDRRSYSVYLVSGTGGRSDKVALEFKTIAIFEPQYKYEIHFWYGLELKESECG